MGKEYNSRLIAGLYGENSDDEFREIIDEMGDIGDPVFIFPLRDSYYINFHKSFSHFYYSALGRNKSTETPKVVLELLKFTEMNDITVLAWGLEALNNLNSYPEDATRLAVGLIEKYTEKDFRDEAGVDWVDLGYILSYLKSAKKLEGLSDKLYEIFTADTTSDDEKSLALKYFVRIDTKKNFEKLIFKYKSIQNPRCGILIAKELRGWNGPRVTKLRELIVSGDNQRAADLIREQVKELEEKDKKEEKEKIESDQQKFGNAEIVTELLELRREVNQKALAHEQIGFSIIYDSDRLGAQVKTSDDEPSIVKSATDLRSVVLKLNSEQLKKHGLAEDRIKELLPGVKEEDYNKGLNALFLFLESRNLKNEGVNKLRDLNQLLSLIGAHPESEDELIPLLKKLNKYGLYEKRDWSSLHTVTLEYYRDGLKELITNLSEKKPS